MERTVGGVVKWARSPEGRKLVRYSMVSVVAVVCSQAVLAITYGLFHWSARTANITAVGLSAIPSYTLNRAWVWRRSDRSSFLREIVPFWGMCFLGLVLSTWSADFAATHADEVSSSHLVQTLLVMSASLAAFGVLWVGKFILLEKLLFAPREEVPAIEGG